MGNQSSGSAVGRARRFAAGEGMLGAGLDRGPRTGRDRRVRALRPNSPPRDARFARDAEARTSGSARIELGTHAFGVGRVWAPALAAARAAGPAGRWAAGLLGAAWETGLLLPMPDA